MLVYLSKVTKILFIFIVSNLTLFKTISFYVTALLFYVELQFSIIIIIFS